MLRSVGCLTLLMLLSATVDAQSFLYRYTKEDGSVVIDDRIPPAYSKRGYSILNPDGTLYEEVPRELTAEELEQRSSEETKAQLEQQRLEQQRKRDEFLLRRYSTVSDIEAARERAINSLTIRLNILKSNLLSIKSQIEKDQSRAADIEREGRVVPKHLAENIATLRAEIHSTEIAIQQRQVDVNDVRAAFEVDIERFKDLQELVERRRQIARPRD